MDDELPADGQWGTLARERYRVALSELIIRLQEHGDQIVAMSGRQREIPELFACNDAVARAAQAFDDAVFEFTGTAVPWNAGLDHDDEAGTDEDDEPALEFSGVVAVLRREDYLVTDHDRVIEAGRRAYLQTWPNDEPDDAEFRVDGLGVALYELVHAHGEANLREVFIQSGGLLPGRSTILFAQAPDQINPDADGPFRDAHGQALPVLYRLTNI